jgi:hypothetical protein|tara:strand:+ start:782 stop:1363 length:582 start_codon:yes stop_codon:yes gene_type:complete
MSVFQKLSSINFKDRIKRKGQLDYVSWADAWSLVKKHYPDAQRTVYEHEHTGLNFFSDGHTAYVKVGITIDGLEHIDMLPVMDYRNKAMSVDTMTAFDVNKTIQRSTAKAIAMHGLGLQLWTGEDLPSSEPTPTTKKAAKKPTLKVGDGNWDKVVKYVQANKDKGVFEDLVKMLETKYTKLSQSVIKELKKHV